ncbi:AMP-binding protein, partial [Halomonas sp.]|uniref:AMP-binding protein n=1 Tax=Halomonas sp. TaxID=1486246 RepID=UPI0035624B2D
MPGSPEAFLARLARHAAEHPDRPAMDDGHRQLRYGELATALDDRCRRLARNDVRRVALALDNGLEWALWDLALLREARVSVPVPTFFSDVQRRHLVASAGLDAWIGPGAETLGFSATQDP